MAKREDRQGKDYYAKERSTLRFDIFICISLLVILIGVDIGMIILKQPAKEIVTGFICTALLALGTGALIAYYRKNFVLPFINDTEVDPRKAAMYSRKNGEDMFDVCDRNRKRFLRNSVIILSVLAVLVVAVIFMNPETTYLGITIPPAVMAIFYILILVLCAGAFLKTYGKFKGSDDLRRELYIKGFDPDKVNLDFMHGSAHGLPNGLLVIGQDYCVVFNNKTVHVCAINDIMEVKGVTNIEGSKADSMSNNRWLLVHLVEKQGLYSFSCSNDISLDTIVDEFRKKGIETGYKILKEDKEKRIEE